MSLMKTMSFCISSINIADNEGQTIGFRLQLATTSKEVGSRKLFFTTGRLEMTAGQINITTSNRCI